LSFLDGALSQRAFIIARRGNADGINGHLI